MNPIKICLAAILSCLSTLSFAEVRVLGTAVVPVDNQAGKSFVSVELSQGVTAANLSQRLRGLGGERWSFSNGVATYGPFSSSEAIDALCNYIKTEVDGVTACRVSVDIPQGVLASAIIAVDDGVAGVSQQLGLPVTPMASGRSAQFSLGDRLGSYGWITGISAEGLHVVNESGELGFVGIVRSLRTPIFNSGFGS